MLEELNYTSVMKPVFSPDRLATTDLTHTIIGASNLTNSVLASDLCRQALREKRMENPGAAEVKCSDVLHCHLGKVTVSPSFLLSFLPSFCSGSPLPRGAGATRGPPGTAPKPRACPQPPRSSRAPRAPLALGMDRREKGGGAGEAADSQSGAAMAMEECEAADAAGLSQGAPLR